MLVRLKCRVARQPEGVICKVEPFLGDRAYWITEVVFGNELSEGYKHIVQREDFEVLDGTIKKPLGGEGQDASGGRGMGEEKQPDRTT